MWKSLSTAAVSRYNPGMAKTMLNGNGARAAALWVLVAGVAAFLASQVYAHHGAIQGLQAWRQASEKQLDRIEAKLDALLKGIGR